MTLPKLEVKTYNLTLPSTGEEIKYRPFLVKEQKTLLMAQESKKDDEIVDAMSQLINDCTFGKVDPKTAPMFDVEYIFLKVRTQSVGSKVDMVVTCPDDVMDILVVASVWNTNGNAVPLAFFAAAIVGVLPFNPAHNTTPDQPFAFA